MVKDTWVISFVGDHRKIVGFILWSMIMSLAADHRNIVGLCCDTWLRFWGITGRLLFIYSHK